MEPVHSIPSTVSVPQTVAPRPAPTPVLQAVPTDLSPAQTVTASDTGGAISGDVRNAELGLTEPQGGSPGQNAANGQSAQNTQNGQNAQGGQDTAGSNGSGTSGGYRSSILIDPTTHEVIYRVVDVRTQQVVRQIPAEAMLRAQAYNLALANGKSQSEALAQADLEA
jgi:hypothetical protein